MVMDSRRSSSSSSSTSTSKNGEASPAFKNSLQENLDLWVGSVPSENDPSFQDLIHSKLTNSSFIHHDGKLTTVQGHTKTTGLQDPAHQLFEPKDQHCGIWEDSPNKESHASLGDQGTTASVSCFGDLMQMSQFLGAGSSGVFSIDHDFTDEPYLIVGRAEDLNKLRSGADNLSFGLHLPSRFLPDQVPKTKWVNWRWPRYECKCHITNRASEGCIKIICAIPLPHSSGPLIRQSKPRYQVHRRRDPPANICTQGKCLTLASVRMCLSSGLCKTILYSSRLSLQIPEAHLSRTSQPV